MVFFIRRGKRVLAMAFDMNWCSGFQGINETCFHCPSNQFLFFWRGGVMAVGGGVMTVGGGVMAIGGGVMAIGEG